MVRGCGGVVTDEPPLGEGLNIVMPWNKVYIYNVKQQEFFEGNMQVLSSNGLEISLDVSVLYQPKYDELGLLHKNQRGKLRQRGFNSSNSCGSAICCWALYPRATLFNQARCNSK